MIIIDDPVDGFIALVNELHEVRKVLAEIAQQLRARRPRARPSRRRVPQSGEVAGAVEERKA